MVQYVRNDRPKGGEAGAGARTAHMLARIVVDADIACRVGMAILEYGPYGYRRCAILIVSSCDVVYADKITPRVGIAIPINWQPLCLHTFFLIN